MQQKAEGGARHAQSDFIYVLLLFLFAAGVASATTVLGRPSPSGDDFCFGYAICE
jgi:hypothetical protein